MFRTALLFAICCTIALAQNPIDDVALERTLTERCKELLARRELVPCPALVAQAAKGPRGALPAVAPRTVPLDGPDLHDLVAKSARIVGHFYLCKECDDWHFSAASGCCLSVDGAVATCAHVLAPDDGMREAYLVSADLAGNVFPVAAVLAADSKADVCILATAERGGVPLPLRTGARVGEALYCLSNPDHFFGYFAEGRLARRYLERPTDQDGAVTSDLAVPPPLWLHVSCPFARGSSGGPIVDTRGNLVGLAQSTTTIVYDEAAVLVDTQMVLRTASPAEALQALVRAPAKAADGGK